MADLAQALATQLANIEKRSGKSLQQLAEIMRASGLVKHGELRDMLKRDLGMGHADRPLEWQDIAGPPGAAALCVASVPSLQAFESL